MVNAWGSMPKLSSTLKSSSAMTDSKGVLVLTKGVYTTYSVWNKMVPQAS